MPFTECHYAYGSDIQTSHGICGFSPKLGGTIEVCDELHYRDYTAVASLTAELMREVLGGLSPETDIELRTESSFAAIARNELIIETYFIQEFMPGGRDHPLYREAIMWRVEDFRAAVQEWEASRRQMRQMLCLGVGEMGRIFQTLCDEQVGKIIP